MAVEDVEAEELPDERAALWWLDDTEVAGS